MKYQYSTMANAVRKEELKYQQEQASRARQAEEVQNRQIRHYPGFLKVSVISIFWIVASITALILFFMSSPSAKAQGTFAEGEDPGVDLEIVYLIGGIMAFEENDIDKAREYFDWSLVFRDDFAPAYAGHSYLALIEEDFDLALEFAEQAFELNPDDNAVNYVLAEAHFASGNYQEALDYYDLYLRNVEENGEQPLLITRLLDGDSLEIVLEHRADCLEALTI